jgi:transposase-like protein
MKSIIKKRREVKATCPRCKSPDYKEKSPDFDGGKPNYVCGSCGYYWQYGYDGGKYHTFKS